MRINTFQRAAFAAFVVTLGTGVTTLASPSPDGPRSGKQARVRQRAKAERKAHRLQRKQLNASNRAAAHLFPTIRGSDKPPSHKQNEAGTVTVPYFPADLTSIEMATGELLDGDLEDLTDDDNDTITLHSGHGDLPGQIHLIETVFSATTDTPMPIAIALSLDARSSENGLVVIRLRNWKTHEFEEVARTAIGLRSSRFHIDEIAASRYISQSGELQLSFQQIVTIPVFAETFRTEIDWVEVGVF